MLPLLQVSSHSTPLDCWVSFLGGVYNITRIIKVRACCLHAALHRSPAHCTKPGRQAAAMEACIL